MSTLSSLRRYVASAISPRITTQHIPTSSDKVDSAFAQVAEDSVELLSTYLGTDQADVGQEKMAKIAKRHPEAMELLQTLSRPGIEVVGVAHRKSTIFLDAES